MADTREQGFTLIELLVVILVISILAAIAIPVFAQQRYKGWAAQSKSALKNAATAAESYAVDKGGDYSALAGDDGTMLAREGYRRVSDVSISVAASALEYCITAIHSLLPAGDAWKTSTYNSTDGSPSPVDVDSC